jgi:hypothetical protein
MTTKAIVTRHGLHDRTVRRINEAGEKYGEPPPWEQGPVAMMDWHLRHGRPFPSWLTSASCVEFGSTPAASAATDDNAPVETDSVKVMQGLVDAFNARIAEQQRAGAPPAALAALGKDYSRLCISLDKMKAERRAFDDNLIDKARVVAAADKIHGAMPGRIRDDLLAAETDAQTAAKERRWREWVNSYCDNSFRILAGSFAGMLVEPAEEERERAA